MKKGVVHKVVVHYFVDFIKKSHKINSLFIFFTSVCLRRFFLLYSYLSIHSPNAKAYKTALYFWMTFFSFLCGCSLLQLHFSTTLLVL